MDQFSAAGHAGRARGIEVYAVSDERQRHPVPEAEAEEVILGSSSAMQTLYRQVRQAASSEIPVLIVGETGTGKDLVARAIHMRGARRDGPFVPVHLGALPPELVASELFGHERGAFTGATSARAGKFEAASGGSIFLDEISTVEPRMQVSLLRLIEQKKFQRLGGEAAIPNTARILAATNEDLDELVDAGGFREDLLYRLDVFRITAPPLRQRAGDIPLLARAFLARYAAGFGKDVHEFAPECLAALEAYDWPGNVRELKNSIQRAVLVSTGPVLAVEHFPARFRAAGPPRPGALRFEVGASLAEVEEELIRRTLDAEPNRTRAAEILGISRRTLYNRLRMYGID